MRVLLAAALIMMVAMAATSASAQDQDLAKGQPPRSADAVRQQLEQIARRRIFFGHQSVGDNLLEGLAEVSREAGATLRVVESAAPDALDQPGLAHQKIGQNEQPDTKIAQFGSAMEGGLGAKAEIALYKFCYIDFGPDRDAADLFARYRAAHQALRAKYPGTTFVHVTTPLTTVQRGVTGWFKNTLGKGAWGERENVRRHQFNELLRKEYGGKEPLFDLAQVESTGEDGSQFLFERGGAKYPAMQPAYSDDGGHLNSVGRRRAALALISTLASLPPAPSR